MNINNLIDCLPFNRMDNWLLENRVYEFEQCLLEVLEQVEHDTKFPDGLKRRIKQLLKQERVR